MSKAIKVDDLAFGRGVDEVIMLKPVRRAVQSFIYQGRAASASVSKRSERALVASEGTYKDGKTSKRK